ncbi:MAG: carbon monoxide dehydrogenase, partial [Deltaproteobacteria bacterium]|nr:carbon monoxide dehydrogenase [Deltaproteobacteria bacterium]
ATRGIDAFIVVVEPGSRSLKTARQIKKLAADLGINQVYVVGNKISQANDKDFITDNLDGIKVLGFLDYDQEIITADRHDKAPFEVNQKIVENVKKIYDNLKKELGHT